jgi:enamine deaminase RidA (YjgF/YER057c/UK114 family)|tara:strand:+ start:251 stop:718 length:468 start_codon:yes stop_codon:yes gene_type:complete
MSKIDKLIKKLDIELPNPPLPIGNYLAHTIVNNLVYISGQLPINKKGQLIQGKLGDNLNLEEGKEAAKLCILNSIAHLKNAVKDLDRVKKCVKINGYINSTKDFTEHAALLNSASDTLVQIFGEKGKHVRAVVGLESLPLGAAIEIETIFEIEKC